MTSLAERVESLAAANHVPLSVHLELTHSCNLRCCHCYLSKDDGEELSFDEVESALGQLSEAGCLFLILTGGEIFLREDLYSILDVAKKKGFAITLFTNGTLIDSLAARHIEMASPLGVEISIYGQTAETHDRVTGVRGSFNRTIGAVKLLREREIKVTLKCPLMDENLGEYRGILSMAEALGVNCRFDPIITPKNDGGRDTLSHRIGGEDLLEALRELRLYPRRPRPIRPDGAELLCNAGITSCSISPYGDVYPCIQLLVKLGNLREKPFRKIWKESNFLSNLKALRNSDLQVCKVCRVNSYCNRCPGLALLEDGDLLGPCTPSCHLAELRGRLAEASAGAI